jgi:hypothetical protein
MFFYKIVKILSEKFISSDLQSSGVTRNLAMRGAQSLGGGTEPSLGTPLLPRK